MRDNRSAESATVSWRGKTTFAGVLHGQEGLELSMKDSKDWLQFPSKHYNPPPQLQSLHTRGRQGLSA